MVSLPLFDEGGKTSESISASDSVFGITVDKSVLHTVVENYRAGIRRGTASAKTRAQVRGGGKKPWKQKGTGRARVGSIRSPLWNGGGVTFGPKPRDYSKPIPKKVKALALNMALSGKAQAGQVKVIKKLSISEPKTKKFLETIKGMEIDSALMVLDDASAHVKRAAANVAKIKVVNSKNLLVFDILKYGILVLDQSAISNLEERFQTK